MQTSLFPNLFPNNRAAHARKDTTNTSGKQPDPGLIMAVLAFLRTRGFDTKKVDDNGDIFFCDEEGRDFIYSVAAMGHTCQSIVYPRFFKVIVEEEWADAQRAAVQVGIHVQVVKICPINDWMWARVDVFGCSPSALIDVFDELMHALLLGAKCFCESMEGGA